MIHSFKSGQKSVEVNGDLDLESDPHRATNLLNLFMVSISFRFLLLVLSFPIVM